MKDAANFLCFAMKSVETKKKQTLKKNRACGELKNSHKSTLSLTPSLPDSAGFPAASRWAC